MSSDLADFFFKDSRQEILLSFSSQKRDCS